MRANTFVSEFAEVAVHAENLKTGRIVISPDPMPNTGTDFSARLGQ